MTWNDWSDYRPRIRPTNGIRSRTQRGKFGRTWWAGRWIAALERLGDGRRLARGRTYARGGQVLNLDVGPRGVEAAVQGSRRQPYTVSIRFRTLSDGEWERVFDAMGGQALYAAKLLSGQMPEQIEQVFEDVGTSLLPAQAKDLIADCSCPDWSNPCKHIAAVHYLLGERFDDDPFVMFALRGRSKDTLLAALRERRGGATADAPVVPGGSDGAAQPVEPLPADPAAFWAVGAQASTPTFSFEAPAIDALPIRRLGAPPFWPDAAVFTPLMQQIYRAISEHAQTLIIGAPEDRTTDPEG